MEMVEYSLCTMEIFFHPMRIDPAVRFSCRRRNDILILITDRSHHKLRRKKNGTDTAFWKAIILADLFAHQGLVTGEKVLAECMSPVEYHRQVSIHRVQPVAQSHHHKRGCQRA